MSLTLHTIKPAKGARKSAKRVGRGIATGKGKTSGRGMKGQRARSGGKGGLTIKGMKQTLIRIPKKRGFKSGKVKPLEVTLTKLAKMTETLITPDTLKAAGLIKTVNPGVKILGTGDAKPNMVVRGCAVTKGAREKIEAAGGKVE